MKKITQENSISTEQADETPVLSGLKPVLELLQINPASIDTIFLRKGQHSLERSGVLDLCRDKKVRFVLTDSNALDKLCPTNNQGIVARLYTAGFIELDELIEQTLQAPLPLIIALDQVQDTGNVGTLARSLYAFGGGGILVPKHNSAYLGAGARRAAAGTLERLPIAKITNLARSLDTLQEAQFTIYGTSSQTPTSIDVFTAPLTFPAVLVLGNEDEGIRQNVLKRCDHLLHIPMLRTDIDSINVAQAGSIITSFFLRQKLAN